MKCKSKRKDEWISMHAICRCLELEAELLMVLRHAIVVKSKPIWFGIKEELIFQFNQPRFFGMSFEDIYCYHK